MNDGNTQDAAEPSPASASSHPVAWAAINDDGDIAWIGYTEEGAADAAAGRTIVPLYTHPVPPDRPVGLGFDDMRLTDGEREAIERGIDSLVGVEDMSADAGKMDDAAACLLCELLERLG